MPRTPGSAGGTSSGSVAYEEAGALAGKTTATASRSMRFSAKVNLVNKYYTIHSLSFSNEEYELLITFTRILLGFLGRMVRAFPYGW